MEFLTLVVGSLLLPLLLSPLIVPAVTTTQVIPSEEETKIEKEAETTTTITEDNGLTTTYTLEEYEKKAAEYEEMRRKEQEKQKKRDEFYQKYGSKYFLEPSSDKVYPKLNGKDPAITRSSFLDDDPYSYSQDVYYKYKRYNHYGYAMWLGKVLQWIDENIVLYDFSRSLGMVIIDRSIDANPFHRNDVFYQYIGVYDYTTVSGRYNVVPVFKIVYPLDPDKLN
ncbi:hypothetical protein [Treponema sp.]|uniref:hypothetical protein n=1 Tax=Treponema sp. TaxID=166 RepID=UPI00257A3F03|nr:hypothetical protein [Treponema sp.]